ncbi:MAG: beta-lactamase [Gemmatimonadetes bacterium]|nr:beta-lactamase [Gemmatimonadota bacterium]
MIFSLPPQQMLRLRTIPALCALLTVTAGLAECQRAPVPPDCSGSDTSAVNVAPTQVRFDCGTLAAVDAMARQAVLSGYTPGLSIAIMRGSQLILSQGYGKANIETDSPVTPATVFPIYSISKTFTASAIMQLRDAGRLSLDDKLAKFLPAFPRGDQVSLRQLLSHTSGIHDYMDRSRPDEKTKFTFDRILEIIQAQTPLYDFDPGAAYRYSNSNFALLAKIVELTSGMPYRTYVRDSVIARADLQQTDFDAPMDIVPGRVSGYWRTSTAGTFVNGSFQDPSFGLGASGIRSTALEMAHWLIALFGGKVVSPASFKEMTTSARLNDGRLTGGSWGSYGLGMEIQSCQAHRAIGHSGATTGFSADARRYVDDDLEIVVLANSSTSAVIVQERIAKLMLIPGSGSTACSH